MREDLAAVNVTRTYTLAASNIAIFTFMLFFLYPRFESGKINPLLFQAMLIAMGIATFSLVFATLHYYRCSLGGPMTDTERTLYARRADRFWLLGYTTMFLAPSLVLFLIGLHAVAFVWLAFWLVYLSFVVRFFPRIQTCVAIGFFLITPTWTQAQSHQTKDDKTKIEIQKLFSDLNEAITKRDRPRLEQLYADEFQFVRPSGGVINKVTQISGIMSNDPLSSTPIPAPANESLMVYGDVVVSRHTVRGTAVTSIFVKKDSGWQLLQAQGTRLAPERNPVKLDPKSLDSFLGKYEFGPNAIATVTREGDTIRWRGGNRMPVTLVPLSETHFFAKETETEIMFVKSDAGQVTGAVLRLGSCQDSKAKKIE